MNKRDEEKEKRFIEDFARGRMFTLRGTDTEIDVRIVSVTPEGRPGMKSLRVQVVSTGSPRKIR